jgi:AcrR family transcriptional regulator
VLAAAAAVAGRRGYHAATIEEIAAEAGVSKQTIYRWWPDKLALFTEVYEDLVPRDAFEPNTGSLVGDLEAVAAALSELYAGTAAGNILSGLIAEAQADPRAAAQLRETYVAPRRTIIGSILDRAVMRGEIPPVKDPNFASDLFAGAIWFRLLLGERRLDHDFTRRLVHAVVRTVSGDAT